MTRKDKTQFQLEQLTFARVQLKDVYQKMEEVGEHCYCQLANEDLENMAQWYTQGDTMLSTLRRLAQLREEA